MILFGKDLFLVSKKFLNSWAFLPFLIFFITISCSLWENRSDKLSARVTKVIDADSIVVETTEGTKKIRFLYIDAPELKQKASFSFKGLTKMVKPGEISTKYLKSLIDQKEVQLKIYGKDIYNRDLAVVYYKDLCINYELIKAGMAWIYKYSKFHGAKTKESFIEAFKAAKEKKIGIWKFNNLQDPYYYRKKLRRLKRKP